MAIDLRQLMVGVASLIVSGCGTFSKFDSSQDYQRVTSHGKALILSGEARDLGEELYAVPKVITSGQFLNGDPVPPSM